MENLKFTIEDREIAELLGRQNFSTKESAVFELLKNSYDAGSAVCNIYVEDNCIKIIDSGKGMNDEDIKNNWMHIGKSNKGYKDESSNRIYTGSKGVGRLALARLGNRVRVLSKKKNENAIVWETDWVTSGFEKIKVDFDEGTSIEIVDLRDKWRSKDIDNLVEFLNRAYKSEEMNVFVHFRDAKPYTIQSKFKDLKIGINYVTKILLNYDSTSMKLTVTTESDEFKPEVTEIVGPSFARYYKENFNMEDELKNSSKIEDIDFYLTELGNFSAEFYFGLEKQLNETAEKFMYKYNGLSGLNKGIALYRNDFSISSLDGKKDWLDIASRARKSTAAATHPTGSWRVRLNQISGYVLIDKEINAHLKDMANRQGLEEDEFYQVFTEIIHFGISRFEKNRQKIIRNIDARNHVEKSNENKKKLKEFLTQPTTVTKMSKQEIVSLAAEIKDIQREAKQQSKVYKESELKHKYDVRILNVLATQGLRASAIAHELQNKRNALSSGYQDVVNALVEFGFWEELNSEEYTRVSYMNVPKTLENLEEINVKLIAFLDVILNKIEKKKFNTKVDSIESVIKRIIDIWKQQYNWINFEISVDDEIQREYKFSDDVFEVILDNLILNSIQHNELKDKLLIEITVKIVDDLISLKYSDNGVGLHRKYNNDPKRILEVHETTRSDGHGLGMWIVDNTAHMYGGKVIDINGENGFNIQLTMKG
ncbi:ATP-binding protein [Bacillus amyloliquefaciens]|uniref:ATP-binding protein n=1 Tax=Bacillus amyloliquefaciens TaxID=1390 RepID=UPI0022AFC7D5|nr:ATP-binding protein [Bacillus amyloliquefaciens]MCZ4247374.1 ATP-binding protein [Bacillus amyloliquefaciens]